MMIMIGGLQVKPEISFPEKPALKEICLKMRKTFLWWKRKSGRRWIVEKANIPFSVKQKPRFSFPLFAALLRSLIDYAASGKWWWWWLYWNVLIMEWFADKVFRKISWLKRLVKICIYFFVEQIIVQFFKDLLSFGKKLSLFFNFWHSKTEDLYIIGAVCHVFAFFSATGLPDWSPPDDPARPCRP